MFENFFAYKGPRLVGTYHKTGTVWLRDLFKRYARKSGCGFIDVDKFQGPDRPLENSIYLQHHMEFSEGYLSRPVPAFRMIRDPRDVVISGAHYHVKSTETWLHKPRQGLNGKSYQKAITAVVDQLDRYRFEMQHVGAHTIKSMWNADSHKAIQEAVEKYFLTVKYEDLIVDPTGSAFMPIIRKLKLHKKTAIKAYQFTHIDSPDRVGHDHVRSGRVAQWRDKFDRKLAQEFAALYQGALEELGYEQNSDWVRQL